MADLNFYHNPNACLAQGLFERGLKRLAEGDFAQAITDFNDAIVMYPSSHLDAAGQFGADEAEQVLLEMARAAVVSATDRELLADIHFARGLAFRDLGKLGHALRDMEEVCELSPEYPRASDLAEELYRLVA